MKKKIVVALIMCMCAVCMVGCGKKKVSEPTEVVDSIVEETNESIGSTIVYPSTGYEYVRPTVDVVESSEVVEIEEIVPQESSEEFTEEAVESTESENNSQSIIPESEMVHVVVPEENLGGMNLLYSKADYKVEGSVDIDDSINFGICVDSTKVKELITLIYQGTGCSSHVISDEYTAIFDYDPYDYSARMTLSDGTVYCLYLVEDMCFALKEI